MRCWCGPLRPIYVDIKDADGKTAIFLSRPLACQEFCFPCCLQVHFLQIHMNYSIVNKFFIKIIFPIFKQSIQVQSPHGNTIGSVQQKWGLRPILQIKDETNAVVFIVQGPLCQFSCRCGDVEFPVSQTQCLNDKEISLTFLQPVSIIQIYASDGISECGKISKRWRGVLHEALTDADIFGVKFPPGINPQMKALLIGATFLIVSST